ncbi:MAG: YybH family protein [Bellilinea sp.]
MNNLNQSTKSSHQPENRPHLFTERLNAGDLDGVVALYEPDAHFVASSGETLTGREQVRLVLAELLRTQTQMQAQVIKVINVGDIAVLYTNFQGTTTEASGKTVQISQKAIEILRRQADGSWRLVVGDPNARGH